MTLARHLPNDIPPNDAQHKTNTKRHSAKRPSMQSIVMLSVVRANCPNKARYAECRSAVCHKLNPSC